MKPAERIAALIGESAAAILCERLGGTSIYIPAYPSAGTRLVLAIGHAAAARICDAMAGEYLRLPSRLSLDRARRREAILYDLRRGLSPNEVAIRHGITDSHVRSIRSSQEP